MPHIDHYNKGLKIPSATELTNIINKPFLDKWKQGLCEPSKCGFVAAKEIAEEAASLGNMVHEEMERYLNTGDTYTQTAWGEKIISKLIELKVEKYLVDPEAQLIDHESNLAGSPDFVGKQSNLNSAFIGDFKIKNSLDTLTGLQGMSYRYLIKRKYGEDISQMLILWAQKKSKSLTVKPVWIDLNEWVEPWKALITLWNVINPSRKVKILD